MKKRILAVVLACLMTVSVLGVTASAAQNQLAAAVYQSYLGNSDGPANGEVSTFAITPPPVSDPAEFQEMEPNNGFGSADGVNSHTILLGEISNPNDVDFFRVYVGQPGYFTSYMLSTSLDAFYGVYNSNQEVESAAEYVGRNDSGYYVHELNFFVGVPGTYYIAVLHNDQMSFNNPVYGLYYLFRPYVNKYVDVFPGSYYYSPVQWADTVGVTSGVDSNHFGPDQVCSRAQLVFFLWKYAGAPSPSNYYNPFSDVHYTDYFYDAVLWAVENGITSGMNYGYFGSYEPCTRAQMVSFIWNLYGRQTPQGHGQFFYDVDPNAYYYTPVQWAVEVGITSGLQDYYFGPHYYCTRAQAVTFLYNAP